MPPDNRQIYRLTDLEVEEVSLVDRPANQRPFLVVKRQGDKMPKVKTDGRGNHTVDKADAGKTTTKTLAERMTELAAKVEKGEIDADEFARLTEEAKELAAKSDAAADEDGDAAGTDTAQKRGRLSRARRRKLRQVVETLHQILTEVEPDTGSAEKTDDKAAAASKAGGKGKTAKRSAGEADGDGEVAKLRAELDAVKKQLAAKSAPSRNSLSPEDDGDLDIDVEAEGWPLDMNAPVSKGKTHRSRSFYQ